jgi:hypothetical protein
MIHGDVFRSPPLLNFFCAMIGAGAQIFFTLLLLLVAIVVGAFKVTRRGALLTNGLLIFTCCAFLGGMISGRLFKQLKGKNWAWNAVFTASIFPVPLGIVFMIVNTIAWSYNSTAALPFLTILVSFFFLSSPFVMTLILFSFHLVNCLYLGGSSFSINGCWCNSWKKFY